MNSILVTGATGFLGSKLLPLLAGSYRVYALGRCAPEESSTDISWICSDLSTPLDLSQLPRQIDAIVHLAQSRKYDDFPASAHEIFSINTASTLDLLEYGRSAGIKIFIYASSGGIYGTGCQIFTESHSPNPVNFYHRSKYASELLLSSYEQFFSTVVFRFFFLYGAGQKRMLIGNLLSKVLRSEAISIQGNPGIRINPIYIDDAARVFEPALTLGQSAILNVAGDAIVSMTDIVDSIGREAGITPKIEYLPSDHADLIADNTRMKEMLGVIPLISFDEGIQRLVDWTRLTSAIR